MRNLKFGFITQDFDRWFIDNKPVAAYEWLWIEAYDLEEDAAKAKEGEILPCRTLMACFHEAVMQENGICRFERFSDGARKEEQFYLYGFTAIRSMPECLE
jgi:hypothetical protein